MVVVGVVMVLPVLMLLAVALDDGLLLLIMFLKNKLMIMLIAPATLLSRVFAKG